MQSVITIALLSRRIPLVPMVEFSRFKAAQIAIQLPRCKIDGQTILSAVVNPMTSVIRDMLREGSQEIA
jgi:hypothetical protein